MRDVISAIATSPNRLNILFCRFHLNHMMIYGYFQIMLNVVETSEYGLNLKQTKLDFEKITVYKN